MSGSDASPGWSRRPGSAGTPDDGKTCSKQNEGRQPPDRAMRSLVERDERCRRDYEAYGTPGTPGIVERGQPQVGFSPQRLQATLQRQARG